MRKILLFLFLCASVLTHAQTFTFSGKVSDQKQEPLFGATIYVKEIRKGTTADGQGNFAIKLQKGAYNISVSYLGYQTKTFVLELNRDVNQNIMLTESENVLDEVLVSAIRADVSIPVTFSNLTKEEIAKRNLGQDIPVLLNYLPSIFSSSDAGAGIGYTYMNVRGSNSERINVTINGIPYNDAESHGTFWVNLGDFASSTQNLQLQRGVGTSTNGSGAFGASLNILTDAISEEAFGEISNSFGSFGARKHTVKFSTGKINEHFELSGRLSNIYSDGYVDRAFADLKSYFLQGSYVDDNTLIKAITFGGKERTYQAWFGLDATQLAQNRRQNPYTYDNEVDDYQQDHFQLHWNEKLNDQWTTNLGLNYTKGSGFFEQYLAGESAAALNNLIVDGTDAIVRRWLDNNFYVVNFNTDYKGEKFNLVTGISYSNYSGDHFGEVIWGADLAPGTNIRDRYYFSDARKSDFSLFAKTTFEINEKLSGYVDLQGRFVGYQTAGLDPDRLPLNVDTNFNFFNPKLGFTYNLNTYNNLYASFAVANREPNRNDFEAGVTTHETLHDYEFGWRYRTAKTKINTNVYYMNYQNQLVLTGAIDRNGQPVRTTSGSSYRLGIEIDADVELSKHWFWRPNVAFSTNKNRNFVAEIDGQLENLGNTTISFSPDVVAGNMITYAPQQNLQFSFLSKYVGQQLMSNFDSRISRADVLDGFFTSDLNIVYQIEPKSIFKSITLTAMVNNIFSKEYVDRGYYGTFDFAGNNNNTITGDFAGFYPQATRNFLLGATLRF